MPSPKQAQQVFRNPAFYSLPPDQQAARAAQVYPEFQTFSPADQSAFLGRLREKYGSVQGIGKPEPPPELSVDSAITDLKLGFRSGLSHLAHTAGNAADAVSTILPTRKLARDLKAQSEDLAVGPEEIQGRGGIVNKVIQGVGAALPGMVEYAPAVLARRYRPAIAGLIGATGKSDEGLGEMAKQFATDATVFGVTNLASRLPLPERVAASGAIAAGATAATGGNPEDIAANAIIGAVGGIPGHPDDVAAAKAKNPAPPKEPTVFGKVKDDVRKWFSAPNRTKESYEATNSVLRPALARLAQKSDQVEFAMRDMRDRFNQLPVNDRPSVMRSVIGDIEQNRPTATLPEFQEFVDTWREVQRDRENILRERGILEAANETYFPHMWKDPVAAEEAYQQIAASKKPLSGSGAFTKERKYVTFEDGLARGLEPITDNPVDLALLKVREIDKYLMAQDVAQELLDSGLARKIRGADPIPPGYKVVSDKAFSTVKKVRGQLIVGDRTVVPESVGVVLENYLSPGLRGNEAVRFAMGLGNQLNMAQLGLSWFHLGMTSLDAMFSQMALSVKKMDQAARSALSGNVGEAGKFVASGAKDLVTAPLHLADAPRGLIEYGWKEARGKLSGDASVGREATLPFIGLPGDKLWLEWMKPGGSGNPELTRLVGAMKDAGARVQLDPIYRETLMGRYREFMDTKGAGKFYKGLMGLPKVVFEGPARVMMEHIVPRQKLGVFMKMAEFELDRLGPNVSEFQQRQALARAWDSVDNRMGQLVYDNLFWSKTWKDILMLSVRSVGWNLGTLRELGGGVMDTAKFLGDLTLPGRNPEVSHRMAYTVALMGFGAPLLSAVTQYLLTGEGPQEIEDYYFPKTGKTDDFGRPERISFPSYVKDFVHWLGDPVKTAKGKIHPLFSIVGDIADNKDYFNVRPWNQDDPLIENLQNVTKYIIGQLTPMSMQPLTAKLPESIRPWTSYRLQEESKGQQIARFVGVTPAPADLKKTPLEKVIAEISEHQTTPKSPKEFERKAIKVQIERLVRQGKGDEAAALAEKSLAAYKIYLDDIDGQDGAIRRAQTDPIGRNFSKLTFDQAVRAYAAATDAQKRKLYIYDADEEPLPLIALLLKKFNDSEKIIAKLSPDEQAEYGEMLNRYMTEAEKKGYLHGAAQ